MDSISEIFFFNEPLSLGQKVRISRIAKRWTQTDLALKANVTQANVSALERDLPIHPAALTRILKVLEMESGNDV